MKTFERFAGIPGVSNAGFVDPSVYRSARPDTPLGYHALKDLLGIKSVLNLETFEDDHDAVVEAGLQSRGIQLIAVEAVPISTYKLALAVIDAMVKPALVHCKQGEQRTGVICAAYRITHGWSLADALEEMDAYGFGIDPLWIPIRESLKAFAASIEVTQ
jgi:tyrosine-protein phosphatase SIW14